VPAISQGCRLTSEGLRVEGRLTVSSVGAACPSQKRVDINSSCVGEQESVCAKRTKAVEASHRRINRLLRGLTYCRCWRRVCFPATCSLPARCNGDFSYTCAASSQGERTSATLTMWWSSTLRPGYYRPARTPTLVPGIRVMQKGSRVEPPGPRPAALRSATTPAELELAISLSRIDHLAIALLCARAR